MFKIRAICVGILIGIALANSGDPHFSNTSAVPLVDEWALYILGAMAVGVLLSSVVWPVVEQTILEARQSMSRNLTHKKQTLSESSRRDHHD
jgi:peptidoglycan/LPS O-acetylase OafA/YrhL